MRGGKRMPHRDFKKIIGVLIQPRGLNKCLPYLLLKHHYWNFPGGPVVKTLCFQRRGHRSLFREQRFQKLHGIPRKKNMKNIYSFLKRLYKNCKVTRTKSLR